MKKSLTVAEAGRLGGQTTFEKYGKEKMMEWSKKGNKARKNGAKQAVHKPPLQS